MASSRSTGIRFDDPSEGEKAELQFQDFSHGEAANLETDFSSSFPDNPDLDTENAGLLAEEKKRPSFWDFAYYQSFFDVDTDQVLQRILWSMVPVRGRATYLDRFIRPNPDLYGPFWISTTLIFSIAISANIAEFFATEGQKKDIWHYDFRKVSIASTAIYSYVFLLPVLLWGLMWYRQSSNRYTFLEILCVYGYSLFIYIPISILWVIQIAWLQWTLVIVGAALSGLVLAHTFWPTVRDENKKIAVVAVCLILLFHSLLAVGFVSFFFRLPNRSHPSVVSIEESQTSVKVATNDTEVKPVTKSVVSREIAIDQLNDIDGIIKKLVTDSDKVVNATQSAIDKDISKSIEKHTSTVISVVKTVPSSTKETNSTLSEISSNSV